MAEKTLAEIQTGLAEAQEEIQETKRYLEDAYTKKRAAFASIAGALCELLNRYAPGVERSPGWRVDNEGNLTSIRSSTLLEGIDYEWSNNPPPDPDIITHWQRAVAALRKQWENPPETIVPRQERTREPQLPIYITIDPTQHDFLPRIIDMMAECELQRSRAEANKEELKKVITEILFGGYASWERLGRLRSQDPIASILEAGPGGRRGEGMGVPT